MGAPLRGILALPSPAFASAAGEEKELPGDASDRGPGKGLMRVYIGLMSMGLVFLIRTCALLGWHHAVGALPRAAGVAAAIFGLVCATALLVMSFIAAASSRWR